MRFFLHLAYLGSNYHGWQRQPNQITVQEVIEAALSKLQGQPTSIMGCGRTDAGVHASCYYAHFDGREVESIVYKLNRILPADIVVYQVYQVAEKAHARFDATSRTYTYITTRDPDPFRYQTVFHSYFFDQLDVAAMNKVASSLTTQSDFLPYCKTGADNKTTICKVSHAAWTWSNNGAALHFNITADRYLRGMVRLLVAMMYNVGLGKMTIEEVNTSFLTGQSPRITNLAPARGLFLSRITYDYIEDVTPAAPLT